MKVFARRPVDLQDAKSFQSDVAKFFERLEQCGTEGKSVGLPTRACTDRLPRTYPEC